MWKINKTPLKDKFSYSNKVNDIVRKSIQYIAISIEVWEKIGHLIKVTLFPTLLSIP